MIKKVYRRRMKLQFADEHCKFMTKFQQKAANFQQMGLCELKILFIYFLNFWTKIFEKMKTFRQLSYSSKFRGAHPPPQRYL